MRVDLHVHTTHSRDGLIAPRSIARWARRRRLDAVAITDHNTIAGALELHALDDLPIIVGEEIRTNEGELIGLFLERHVPPGLSPEETAWVIRQQGGLVYVPHPCDRVRGSALSAAALLRMLGQVDIIEVLNARVTFLVDNRQARALAAAHGLAMGAGSDAHQGYELGRAYVEMAPFEDAPTFLASLRCATIGGRTSSPLVHVASACAKVARELAPFASYAR
ncbi:MAG: PHP domain-containing protein [Chloroflexota bacterium]